MGFEPLMRARASRSEKAQSKLKQAPALQRWNAKIHAFAAFCDPVRKPQPGCLPNEGGSLCGVTVGVKDIIDVAGLPTRNGSDACRDADPARSDAPIVNALRRAGAMIIGKTTTTEFAFTDPTDCRNPYDLARSPGGSSSGSGAAVAAGVIDVALGTQTAGSLCRPAAYCGAVGFKPSFGLLSTCGVTPLAPSFDTVGIIARSVDLAERAFQEMYPAHLASASKDVNQCTTASLLLDKTIGVAPETMEAFQRGADEMGRISADLVELELDLDIPGVIACHRTVMNREAYSAHGHLLATGHILLKPKFLAGLRTGAAIAENEAEAASSRLSETKSAFWDRMSAVDIILTLPVPDGAPLLGGTTGVQDWLTPWTVFGGPLICLPWGGDSLGRPKSIMLAGHPGEEATLLCMARVLEEQSPGLPRPLLPQD
ncbi:MAG: amidase [Rhodobacteraceae bacterium]|nr:amidase [Paracoccaceae bacterium]